MTDLIERLKLSSAVCRGDLWDSTRDRVMREAYHDIADDLADLIEASESGSRELDLQIAVAIRAIHAEGNGT